MTPLSLAVIHKAEDVVDLLLESGADCRSCPRLLVSRSLRAALPTAADDSDRRIRASNGKAPLDLPSSASVEFKLQAAGASVLR
jgi:ankyrin repeat protein